MASYRFCVFHLYSEDVSERFGVEMRFGDIDPGKEAARLLVVSKVKQSTTKAISVDPYDDSVCGEIRDASVWEVEADGETIARLASQIASGDIGSAAVTAVEIAAGITTKTVKEVGRGARKLERGIRKLRKKIFGF